MLEILFLLYLCKQNGRIVEKKERPAGRYMLLTILLWIGCEITGAALGLLTARDYGIGFIYVCALIGAAIGAGLSRLIVIQVSRPPLRTEVFD
jgi:hypothetical protein